MRYQPVPPLVRRWLAALLSLLLGLGPLATPAYAGLTPLADEPINIKNQAKPNIILTVDDSTSMLYDFLPDYVVGSKFCRDATGASMAFCGYSGSPANAGPGGQYVSPQYIWAQPARRDAEHRRRAIPGVCDRRQRSARQFQPKAVYQQRSRGRMQSHAHFPNPPTCTGGIDPGALPGISIYPVASGSPKAGLPYEYWLLWPAPVHNSALNHMYYNPRLTYDPPANSDATSFPQMDAGNTTNWTKVRADPFTTADPLDCSSEPCVDLTANVIVGQWCNSDWTQGNDDSGLPFVTNPGHCRNNGLVAAAAAGAPAAIGDYMYPWAPASITPNDVTTKVDTSVVSISPPTNASVEGVHGPGRRTRNFSTKTTTSCGATSPAPTGPRPARRFRKPVPTRSRRRPARPTGPANLRRGGEWRLWRGRGRGILQRNVDGQLLRLSGRRTMHGLGGRRSVHRVGCERQMYGLRRERPMHRIHRRPMQRHGQWDLFGSATAFAMASPTACAVAAWRRHVRIRRHAAAPPRPRATV